MLVDSNILIYAINHDSPKYSKAIRFISENHSHLAVAHQNILETIRVLTHPKYSKYVTIKKAVSAVYNISEALQIIVPNNETHYIARQMILRYSLLGNRIFDAYLAATAISNGIFKIATDNERDFSKFSELKVTNPFKQNDS